MPKRIVTTVTTTEVEEAQAKTFTNAQIPLDRVYKNIHVSIYRDDISSPDGVNLTYRVGFPMVVPPRRRFTVFVWLQGTGVWFKDWATFNDSNSIATHTWHSYYGKFLSYHPLIVDTTDLPEFDGI